MPSARSIVIAVAFAVAVLGAAAPAFGASPVDIRAGRIEAEKACAGCHDLPPPPVKTSRATSPAGPPFAAIAEGAKSAPEALRAFLLSTGSTVSHPGGMPRPAVTEEQIRVIAAYLASLRGGQ